MTIRPYQKRDWKRLCEIHDPARMDEMRGSVDLKAFLSLEQSAESSGLFDGEVHVALLGEKIVGFVAFDEKEITWLYIDQAHYRQGIGSRLLDFALNQFKGKVLVEVLANNKPAFDLYQKKGFKVLELKHGKLGGNEGFTASGYIMEMEVS